MKRAAFNFKTCAAVIALLAAFFWFHQDEAPSQGTQNTTRTAP